MKEAREGGGSGALRGKRRSARGAQSASVRRRGVEM